MTISRGVYLLFLFGSLAIVVIGLRSEQARAAAQIEQLQCERPALRRESWALEMAISRLRTPERIYDRVAQWSLDLQQPCPPSETAAAVYVMAAR